ncbi:MAG: chemotaxis protein CheW [Archangiaceae bacterium]|nr:chemotaxis protein CheW [Archangiaceae bacterium]
MSEGLDVSEFITGYLAEADEHLTNASTLLVSLDATMRRRETNPKAVRELFRALHTLKGLSAMVGAEPIVDLAHEMETLLKLGDKAGGKLPESSVDLLLKGVKAIEERVKALKAKKPLEPAPKALVDALAALRVDAPTSTPAAALSLDPELSAKLALAEHEQLAQGLARGRRGRRVDFQPTPEKAAAGFTITAVRERVGKVAELVKVVPRATASGVVFALLVLTDATDAVLAEAAGAAPGQVTPITLNAPAAVAVDVEEDDARDDSEPAARDYVRVEVSRLDDALERLSALVVTRSKLERAVARLRDGSSDLRGLQAIVTENARQLRDLRGAIMRARMVRVSELLERAPLIVRGLSRASGKPVHLDVQAGDAELDKTVADRLFPVIVHLLRNAVDHAIERPEERRAVGKSEEGHIRIACADHAGRELELTVTDDGRGIDREKVAQRAGAPVPRDAAELLDLITRPGLSTLDAATRTSGRGYGMDIVRRVTVQELGGELKLDTRPGAGTTFTVRVPLSVTIVDAFSFGCGDETFVVPVSAVDDLAELEPGQVVATPDPNAAAAHVRLFRHRGAAIPLYLLGKLLGCPGSSAERPKVIVARQGVEAIGFQVDRLIGKQEIAIRPLKDPLAMVPGVTGSTDLGDGKATLVLDLGALASRHAFRKASA